MCNPVPCALIAVLLCLLASASTAAAECAWVLWRQSLNSAQGREPWEVWHAYTKEGPCQDDALKWRTIAGPSPLPGKRGFEREGKYTFNFVCLPDTVDPRGPKGK